MPVVAPGRGGDLLDLVAADQPLRQLADPHCGWSTLMLARSCACRACSAPLAPGLAQHGPCQGHPRRRRSVRWRHRTPLRPASLQPPRRRAPPRPRPACGAARRAAASPRSAAASPPATQRSPPAARLTSRHRRPGAAYCLLSVNGSPTDASTGRRA